MTPAEQIRADAQALYDKMMRGDEHGEDALTGAEFNRLSGILTLDIPRLLDRLDALEAEHADREARLARAENFLRAASGNGDNWARAYFAATPAPTSIRATIDGET